MSDEPWAFLAYTVCCSYVVQHNNIRISFQDTEVDQFLIDPMQSLTVYSRIPLSRAPLTRENQLVALAPWTPNFSDPPLATARMTDR